MLKGWTAFTRFLKDGCFCISKNAAQRGRRAIALRRAVRRLPPRRGARRR
jgi:hypothetical protein